LDFALGSLSVRGQATLFDGDPVRTQFVPTRLHVKDGGRYVLGISSEGSIYQDHLVLRSGSAELASTGRTSRIVASSVSVIADQPGSAATVYTNGDAVTVLVRRGAVKVAKLGSPRTTTLAAGRVVTIRVDGRDSLSLDESNAVVEAAGIQAKQIARLTAATRSYSCLETKVTALSNSYSAIASRLAVAQAARNAIQQQISTGGGTAAELRQLEQLNDDLRSLQRGTLSLAEALGGVIFQHHPLGSDPSPVTPHSSHEHVGPAHHDQHGHSGTPPRGHDVPRH
jgi:hypothetical protein